MKGIRAGEQDYELMVLAKNAGHGARAAEIAHGVFARSYQSNATPAAIENARAETRGADRQVVD